MVCERAKEIVARCKVRTVSGLEVTSVPFLAIINMITGLQPNKGHPGQCHGAFLNAMMYIPHLQRG
jgi:hypothetical protein